MLFHEYNANIRLENCGKARETSVSIVGVPAEIRTGHLTNISQTLYHLSQRARPLCGAICLQ
jgi:hypothetical protein